MTYDPIAKVWHGNEEENLAKFEIGSSDEEPRVGDRRKKSQLSREGSQSSQNSSISHENHRKKRTISDFRDAMDDEWDDIEIESNEPVFGLKLRSEANEEPSRGPTLIPFNPNIASKAQHGQVKIFFKFHMSPPPLCFRASY